MGAMLIGMLAKVPTFLSVAGSHESVQATFGSNRLSETLLNAVDCLS